MTERPIIVGVDDSPESARAARVGCHLATALRAPCRLIHVIPNADLLEPVVEDVRRRLAALCDVLPAAALTVEIRIGQPARVLAECAAGAQLIVLGGKAHAALARGLGASTAHALVRSADVPVLVVAHSGWPIRRILAAVDLSFASEPTLAAARRLAKDAKATVRALHVVEPVRAPRIGARVDQDAVYDEALERFTRGGVVELAAGDRVVRRGVAADTVADEAARWAADVVVVGSQGKGWVDRLLIGSVTERLLALLPASLLIVPVRPTEQSPSTRKERRAGTGAMVS